MANYEIRATWPDGSVMVLGTGAATRMEAIGTAGALVPSLMRGARIEVSPVIPPRERLFRNALDTIAPEGIE